MHPDARAGSGPIAVRPQDGSCSYWVPPSHGPGDVYDALRRKKAETQSLLEISTVPPHWLLLPCQAAWQSDGILLKGVLLPGPSGPQEVKRMRPTTIRRPEQPRHVAIIMDGNGRWARQRGLERSAGHDEGARAVRETVRSCRERGIRYLTLYAFSLANWSRPKLEVDALMRLLIRFAEKEAAELKEKTINVNVIGDLNELPTMTRLAVEHLIEFTNELPPGVSEPEMTLSLALSYSGRRDVVEAMRTVAARARSGLLL